MSSTFYLDSLPKQTQSLVFNLQKQKPSFLNSFYLSGGTALSLQLGHRQSDDLDFFNQNLLKPLDLEKELSNLGQLKNTELAIGTVNTFLNKVKLQFLNYPYQLLKPLIDFKGIKISSIIDIACTKLQTISMRGSKKDFIDLYFLLKTYPLTKILQQSQKKYNSSNYNQTHILKSLVYFDDAENQPMPRMIKKIDWDEVKNKIIKEVKIIKF
jgi:predicted nucleotidyltransferase component of viral defense system